MADERLDTGLFHAGAIIGFADETATAASMWELNPTAEFKPELFPLTLQLSVNLIRTGIEGGLPLRPRSSTAGRPHSSSTNPACPQAAREGVILPTVEASSLRLLKC
ncbi:MAG: hypothetical protein ACE5JN_11435 [Candidatus Methylomirabilia bacterium]